MLELYQFELSQYCEKVRLLLDYKGLEYRKIEVTPGIGQFEVAQMSGQTRLPVLKDGETIISDSTEIAFYLERKYPDRPLLPVDPQERGLCLLMEEWADESIGLKSRSAFLGALNQNQALRAAILPDDTPDFLKAIVSAVPAELLDVLGAGVGAGGDALKEAKNGLKQDLEALCLLLQNRSYLVGETPTLADFAVAGLSLLLKFPESGYLDVSEMLAGKGIPDLGDNEAFDRFFTWRDRLYADYRQPFKGSGSTGGEIAGTAPQQIAIE